MIAASPRIALTERMSMDAILVTGGCGFIGSNFISYLLDAEPNVQIINLDRLTYAGDPDSFEDARSDRYRWIEGDICDAPLVRRIVRRGIRAIINFAAESHVDRSIHD